MALRREFLLALGALVAFNVLLAFGSIGLFLRMGPAIEKILEENVESLIAAESILLELAAPSAGSASPEAAARVETALRRAEENITESEEVPVLAAIRATVPAALAGDPKARTRVVREIDALMRINRDAMTQVDEDARRLGNAGAWAAMFIGSASFAMGLIAIVRLRQRIIRPLAELHAVLEAAHAGDPYRRCRPCSAPEELQRIHTIVNALLDERLAERQ